MALLASVPSWATPVAVTWVPGPGAAFSGSTLSGASAVGLGETAVGSHAIAAGASYLDFGTAETNRSKAAGLGSRDGKRGVAAIDFGFLLNADGTASVLESGSVVQSLGSYTTSTRFKVGVESGSIIFRLDGSIVRTSALAFTYPLTPEATPIEAGATIYDAQLEGAVVETAIWSGAVNVNARPGQLSKNGLTNIADAGAASTRAIASGGGYAQFRPAAYSDDVTLGLSNGDSDQTVADIDFGIKFTGGAAQVVEGGTSRGSFGAYTSADVFRISVASGVVTYLKNGLLFYTSLATPSLPLLVDTSITASAMGVSDVVLSGDLVNVGVVPPNFSVATGHLGTSQSVTVTEATAGATLYITTNGADPTTSDTQISSGDSVMVSATTTLKARAFASGLNPSSVASATYTFGTLSTESTAWTNPTSVAASTGEVLKDSASTEFDAGAASDRGFLSMGGYAEIQPSASSVDLVAGLSHLDTDQSPADVDFGLHLNAGGSIEVSEAGVIRGAFGTYASTDVFRVSVTEGVVTYSKNGTVFYVSLIAPSLPLLVDTSIGADGTGITSVLVSGSLADSRTSTPAASPGAGGYTMPMNVSLTGDAGASIRYTTDGVTEPSPTSTLYSAPITLSAATTVKARAFRTGYLDSAVSTNAYVPLAEAPVLTPGPGSYVGPLFVTATTGTAGAEIHYTLNGAEPTGADPFVTSGGSIEVAVSGTLKAASFKTGWATSATVSAAYTIRVADPVLSPASGKWYTQRTISVTTTTPGATIYYTTDGTEPTTSSSVVSAGSVTVDRSMTLKARAFKTGLVTSSTAKGGYAITGDIRAGAAFMVALRADKTVWIWGANGSGQLGRGNTTTPQTTPIQVAGLTDIEAVAAGGSHVIALKSNGTLVAWGLNTSGQLGISNQTNQLSPVAVPSLTNVVAIAAGDSFSMAQLANGEVWAWGLNSSGQLADGSFTMRTAPVKSNYASNPGPLQIAAGQAFSLARYASGTVKAAGYNANGSLGNNSSTSSATPVTTLLPPGVIEVFAGRGDGAFALVISGGTSQIFAWGLNNQGQLALGTPAGVQRTPVLASTRRARVGVGASHALVGGLGGGLAAAGTGVSGELGVGLNPPISLSRPAPISGAPEPAALAGGSALSAALGIDGTVWTWGAGSNGATAQGTTANTYLPKLIVALSLVDNASVASDADGDGLATGVELDLGLDPELSDTNGDGIDDGAALSLGESLSSLDADGDGLTFDQEAMFGTNPWAADTDGDGTGDGTDAYPLDSSRSTNPPPDPNDTTPPVITLQKPVSATPIS